MATYRFEELLGRGGFGEVYLGWRTGPRGVSVRVAVKVLRADLAHPAPLVARLRDEAVMLAAIDHPAVVRLIDLIQVEQRWALVTEYVDGIDLSRLIHPTRRLPDRTIAEVVGALAGGLRALHAAQLVHRDVKPSNVRLSRHGEVKLLDFGIARSEEMERLARTQTGKVPFTLGYTPPEAFVSGRQGPVTDVFALGVTLYRMLCGAKWYGLSLSEQARLCTNAERYAAFATQRLLELQGSCPALVQLVAACVAFEPDQRPTAAEVEAYAEEVATTLDGPSLRGWARGWMMWDVPCDTGPLSGWMVREQGAEDGEEGHAVAVEPAEGALPPDPGPARESNVWWSAATLLFGVWVFCLALVALAALAESHSR